MIKAILYIYDWLMIIAVLCGMVLATAIGFVACGIIEIVLRVKAVFRKC